MSPVFISFVPSPGPALTRTGLSTDRGDLTLQWGVMTDRKSRDARWGCGGLGSRGSSVSLPNCMRAPYAERGAAKTPSVSRPQRQRGGAQPGVTWVWAQPACPSTVGGGRLGFSGNLALGAPDPGRVWLLGRAAGAGGRGCRGARRCRERPARPRSLFRSLLPGHAAPAGWLCRRRVVQRVPEPPQRPWGRPPRGGSGLSLGPSVTLLPLPGLVCSRKHTHPDPQSEKGGNLFYLKGCVINKTKTK